MFAVSPEKLLHHTGRHFPCSLQNQRPNIRLRTRRLLCSKSETVTVYFSDQDIVIDAEPKEPILQVAERAGVHLETGCNTGSCGICEVEVRKVKQGGGSDAAPAVIRSCIARVPPGYERIEISQMSDSIWGSDGWDT